MQGPPSDAQLAQLLEDQKKKRTRNILIFGAVAAVLAVVIGGSSIYFGQQAKKKRNLAYSRVTKCLIGKPLADGEAPMLRFRAAWRGKMLEPHNKADEKIDSEEAKAKAWPNRCVAEMVSFTDTLKELGEMKEGEKDLGFYSRNLSKETAGDNWQNIETYKTALEDFFNETAKAKFDFVDVPDVTAPKLAEAKSIDEIIGGGALSGASAEIDREGFSPGPVRFYVPAGKGLPEKLCESKKGDTLDCKRPIPGGVPPEASGIPLLLGGDDDAPVLLAFGRHGGIASGSSPATGVFRSGDGVQLLPTDKTYYVAGGWSSKAAGSALLLKPEDGDLGGEKFQIGLVESGKPKLVDMKLEDWNGAASAVAIVGADVVWVTNGYELRRRPYATPTAPFITVGKLPDAGNRLRACQLGSTYGILLSTSADRLGRLAVTFTGETPAAWLNKIAIVEEGWAFACGAQKITIVSGTSFSSCGTDGCETKPLEADRLAKRAVIGDKYTVVDVMVDSGMLHVRWTLDGMEMASALYDGHVKGRDVLVKSRLGAVRTSTGRDYVLLAISADEKLVFARADERGGMTAVKVTE